MTSQRFAVPGSAVAVGHVLVVDDDPAIRELVESALTFEGYRVSIAANGREAVEQIARSRPALVLLDLNMPVMSGWQVQEQLRREAPDVPVVFMTAGQRAQIEAERHHAAGALAKPFDLDELFAVVERLAGPPDS